MLEPALSKTKMIQVGVMVDVVCCCRVPARWIWWCGTVAAVVGGALLLLGHCRHCCCLMRNSVLSH